MLKYFLINYMYTLIRKSESSFDNLQPALIVASDYPGEKLPRRKIWDIQEQVNQKHFPGGRNHIVF